MRRPRSGRSAHFRTTGFIIAAGLALLCRMIEFLSDLWAFLRVRKKIWLLPIIVVLALLGAVIVVSQQSVVGTFIYTLF